MFTISPNIKYVLFDQIVPANRLPIIETGSDATAYGTIDVQLPVNINIISCEVYQLLPPTTAVDQYSRIPPNLVITHPDCISYTYNQLSTGVWRITWQFDPSVVSAFDSTFYSLEFFINQSDDAAVAQSSPKVIVKITNEVDFTGITGPAGGSFHGLTGPQGMTGSQGFTGLGVTGIFYTGAQGITGLIGNTGAQGPTGLGVTGLIGATGAQAITGQQGATGSLGPTGSIGATGPRGAVGSQGSTGSIGNTGYNGITGPIGAQGATGYSPTGVQGAQGLTGVIAPTGFRGATGPQGVQGIQGIQGNTGLMAPTGFVGITGSQGPVGVQGSQGNTGAGGITGASSIGSTGPQGQTGVAGPQGIQGIQGNIGSQGVTGLIGPTGAQGAQGIQGNIGSQGVTGLVGSTGPQGNQGVQGNVGPQGVTGLAGATGIQGIQGNTGNTGLQGAQGNKGDTGTIGNTGVIGPTGLIGSTGPQGIQGNVGSQGVTGSTGNTGVIGPTGPQGIQGIQGNTGLGSTGAQGIKGATGTQGLGGYGSPYYFNSAAAGVSGSFGPLESLIRTPANFGETTDAVTVSNVQGTTGLLLGGHGYITAVSDPSLTSIPPGVWTFNIYADTSAVGARDPRVRCDIVKYSSGVESLLLSTATSDQLTLTTSLYTIAYTQTTAIPLLATDRLLCRVWGVQNGNNQTAVITYYYEGTSHTSNIVSTIGIGNQGATGLQGPTGIQGNQGVTGVIGNTGAQGTAGSNGSQGATGVQGTAGTNSGSTGVINISFNNNYAQIAPFTGILGEFEMPIRYNLYGWDALASNGESGYLLTHVSNTTYAAYSPTTVGSVTGPWLNKQMKNTNSTFAYTGAAGDIVRVWATSVTGLSNVTAAIKYNQW